MLIVIEMVISDQLRWLITRSWWFQWTCISPYVSPLYLNDTWRSKRSFCLKKKHVAWLVDNVYIALLTFGCFPLHTVYRWVCNIIKIKLKPRGKWTSSELLVPRYFGVKAMVQGWTNRNEPSNHFSYGKRPDSKMIYDHWSI